MRFTLSISIFCPGEELCYSSLQGLNPSVAFGYPAPDLSSNVSEIYTHQSLEVIFRDFRTAQSNCFEGLLEKGEREALWLAEAGCSRLQPQQVLSLGVEYYRQRQAPGIWSSIITMETTAIFFTQSDSIILLPRYKGSPDIMEVDTDILILRLRQPVLFIFILLFR